MLTPEEINKNIIDTHEYFSMRSIQKRFIRDSFVLYAFSYAYLKEPDNYLRMLSMQIDKIKELGYIKNYKIVFDETLWPLEDENSFQNKVLLIWSEYLEETHLLIDLRIPMKSYM